MNCKTGILRWALFVSVTAWVTCAFGERPSDPVPTERLVLEGHSSEVTSLAFAPDGTILVSGSRTTDEKIEGEIRMWDVATGKQLKVIHGDAGAVPSLAVSPDGKILASGSGSWKNDKERYTSGEITLRELTTGKEIVRLHGHRGIVRCVAFSSDGKHLASSSNDATIRIWNVATGELRAILEGHSDAVESAVFLRGGTLASGGSDETIKIWILDMAQCVRTIRDHSGIVTALAANREGTLFASASYDETAKVWEAASGKCLATAKGHKHIVWSVAISPDGKTLATISYDKTLRLWDANSGDELASVNCPVRTSGELAFSPDGMTLASASHGTAIKLWEVHALRGTEE